MITQASATLANVVGLVFLAGFGIAPGESCLSVQEGFPPSMLATNNTPTAYDAPGAPGGPDLYINEETFREVFCADSSEERAAVMRATQRPLSAYVFTEQATAAGWANTPSWYLVSNQDNAIPPDAQRFMAQRMRAVDTTQIYLHADLEIKQRALARTNQRDTTPGRYRAPDSLLAFLDAL